MPLLSCCVRCAAQGQGGAAGGGAEHAGGHQAAGRGGGGTGGWGSQGGSTLSVKRQFWTSHHPQSAIGCPRALFASLLYCAVCQPNAMPLISGFKYKVKYDLRWQYSGKFCRASVGFTGLGLTAGDASDQHLQVAAPAAPAGPVSSTDQQYRSAVQISRACQAAGTAPSRAPVPDALWLSIQTPLPLFWDLMPPWPARCCAEGPAAPCWPAGSARQRWRG